MSTWNDKGSGGANVPLHQRVGAPTRKDPPMASVPANEPTHKRVKDSTPNTPLHQRAGAPTRSAPPSGGKGKTF